MRAVILAAGRGSRMGGLTVDRPKCLLEVDGRSLLARQAAALAATSEIAVVTGWQAQSFRGWPGKRFHNPRWATSSMLDSLACAREWLEDGPVLVSYGDIVYSAGTVAALSASSAPIALAYDPDWLLQWARRFADPLVDAESFRIDPDGRVTAIGGAPESLAEVEGQYTGLFKLEPDGWHVLAAELRAVGRRDTTGVLNRLIERGIRVTGVPVAGPWHEFDTADDLEAGRPVLRALDRELFSGAFP